MRIYKVSHNELIEINALQSVRIFGWWDQPRTFLSWEDIKSKQLSWKRLRLYFDFPAEDLKRVQPDKNEWIKRGALTLNDLPDMIIFPINPFEDLGADLAEVWNMGWSVEMLQQMNVRYDDMIVRGLSPQLMAYFNIPLSGWQKLGFCSSHVNSMSEQDCDLIFSVPKSEMMLICSTFEKAAPPSHTFQTSVF